MSYSEQRVFLCNMFRGGILKRERPSAASKQGLYSMIVKVEGVSESAAWFSSTVVPSPGDL